VLHPVSLPACANALRKVLEIQDVLLEIACTADPCDVAVLNGRFVPGTVGWLWQRQQKLLKPLETFSVHPVLVDKQAILVAFRHDVTYEHHLDDPLFVFALQPKSSGATPLVIAVGKWLENFYDVLARSGIPRAVTGYADDISQQIILGEFDAANVDMRVCPVCDGTWMEKTITGHVGSIDHFLPRSKYPALSVHPLNLLPVCVVCNEKIKQGKDPLSEGRQRTLADTFHPYYRPARERVELSIDKARPWTFTSTKGATDSQMSVFPDIYALPERWQGREDEIDRMVRRRVRDCVRVVLRKSVSLSQDEFRNLLNDLETDMGSEWGKSSFLYPAKWWLRWLQQNKFDELVRDFLPASTTVSAGVSP